MVLEREAFDPAADRLDLVLSPGVLAIVAPSPAHLPPDVLAERVPVFGASLCQAETRESRACSKQRTPRHRHGSSHLAATVMPRYCRIDAARSVRKTVE